MSTERNNLLEAEMTRDEIVLIDPWLYDDDNITAANIYEDICRKLHAVCAGVEEPLAVWYSATDEHPEISVVAWKTGGPGDYCGISIESGVAAVFSFEIAQMLFSKRGPTIGRVINCKTKSGKYKFNLLEFVPDMSSEIYEKIREVFPHIN